MPIMEANIAVKVTGRTRSPSTSHASAAATNGALLIMTSVLATDVRLNAMVSAVEAIA
jgi:hypothetical protein